MKKENKKLIQLFPLIILIYLVGLLFATTAVYVVPIYLRQRSMILPMTRDMANLYIADADGALNRTLGSDERILVYDRDGICLRHIAPNNAMPNSDLRETLGKYLPKVFSGKEVFTVTYSDLINEFSIISGAPIRDGSVVVGALFQTRVLKNLTVSIWGLFVYFTLFYWVFIFFMLLNVRKRQRLEKLQESYIANVTHSFKTPNASIVMLAETLCDGMQPDPEKQQYYCSMILCEAQKQKHLIQDVLTLSKLQSTGADFRKTAVDTAAVFTQIEERYAALSDFAGVSFQIAEEIWALPPLYTNEAALRCLLELLLDNAIKFVDEGGCIHVSVTQQKKQAVFCIQDDGIGIAKDDLPLIFNRFYKGNSRKNQNGSGLGLAIVKELVAGLKEKIWVESTQGKGTAFFFTVRLKYKNEI